MVWKWLWNTETKYYDDEITRDTDWGGDESTGNQPVSGGRVQEWLKNEINGKFGVIRISSAINENNFYSLEMFSTKEDEHLYDEDNDKYADLITKVAIPISTVQGDAYTGLLSTNISNTASIVTSGDDFIVSLNYRAIKIGKLGNENANASGTLHVQRRVGEGEWTDALTLKNELVSLEPTDDKTFVSVNIGKALVTGKMQVRVRASYEYESEEGDTKTVNTVWVMIGQQVTKTDLRLELKTDYSQPLTLKDINSNYENFKIDYIAHGDVNKTIHVKVKGSTDREYATEVFSNISGEVITAVNINTQGNDGYGLGTHGVKTIEAYMTCDDGLGGTLRSNTLINQVMVATDDSNTNSYLLLQNVEDKAVNYMQTKICEYAVYNPNKEIKVEAAFIVANESGSIEYFRLDQEITPQTKNELVATVEVETETTEDSYAFFRVNRITAEGEKNFIYESTGVEDYSVIIDNKSAFMPMPGRTFHVNPKVRSNNEANPDRILNAKNNNALVDSTFEGFGFVTDGWIENLGQRVLRVPAGGKLTIKRNIFEKFRNQPNSRMTFELDFAVHNVTNTTEPIIDITDGVEKGFRGIRMNAVDGWMCSKSSNALDDCLFSWQEGVRTHVMFNIENEVRPQGPDVTYNGDYNNPTDISDATKVITSVPIARIFINGVLSREIPFSTTDINEWTNGECAIVIGNEGCDIDIYNISAYEGDTIFTPKSVLLKNYIASLTTLEEKQFLYRRNDITDENDRITLDKARAIGLNCMVWHGTLVSKINSEEYKGYYDYYRYDEQGNPMPEYSGTNCKETASMKIKGQGSTAKTYYDWNIQDDNSKVKFKLTDGIWVPLNKIHSSITIGSPYQGEAEDDDDKIYTGLVVDVMGGNLGKNFPVEMKSRPYPYDSTTNSVQLPDGWVDGNGMYRGSGYMVAPGTALAQKKVIKINYASSMQSHLLGACKTYDLLHRKVVGDTPLQKQVPTAVAAKHTEPFLLFHEVDGKVYFKGLGNYGAAKMDKVAWGFAKKKHPEFALIEGSDNNQTMTDFRVPFDRITAVYNMAEEYWQYGDAGSWDFDGGNTDDAEGIEEQKAEGWQFVNPSKDGPEAPTATVRNRWALVANYIYLHGTNIDFFDGTYSQFMNVYSQASDAEKTAMHRKKWWFTKSEGEYQAYCLYRYDELNSEVKPWIDAGLLVGDSYQVVNLKTDVVTKSAYENNVGRHTAMNIAFKKAYVQHMHDTIKYIMNEDSLVFNYCYVLMFLAGSDNSSKNTYFKICPVAESFAFDNSFNDWYKSAFGVTVDFNFSECYRVYLDGDDMDSILRTNNNSHQTKPYYIERRYPYADTDPDKKDCLYEGMNNVLFNYVEGYAEIDENVLPNMMNKILTNAQSLVTEADSLLGNPISKISAWGFLHKYFFNTQYYFPQITYNEQARIRYEFPHMINYVSTGSGARSIKPITQSLGSQLDNELQYMNQRLIYMASFARWSSLCGTNGTLGISGGNEPSFSMQGGGITAKFVLKAHQYIYPTFNVGTSKINTNIRLAPQDTLEYSLNTSTAGDAGFGLYGIDYYNSVGNVGDFYVPKGNVIVQGKRLREFIAEPTNAEAVFRPEGVTVNATQLTKFSMKGCKNFEGNLNLSKLTRCREIDLRQTQSKSLIMPVSNFLHTVQLGSGISEFSIQDLPKLSTLSFEDYTSITNFVVGDNVGSIDFSTHVSGIYNDQNALEKLNLTKITISGVKWTKFPVQVLEWYADIGDRVQVRFNGIISIHEPNELIPSVTWDLKNKFLKAFGDVDDATSDDHRGLLLDYAKKDFDASGAKLVGGFFADELKVYNKEYNEVEEFVFELVPYSKYENTQTKLKFYVEGSGSYIMNEDGTFSVRVYELGKVEHTAVIKVDVSVVKDGVPAVATFSKTIEVWVRAAQVGDLVYYDGTYGDAAKDDNIKTVVGVCCYTAPRKPDGSINEKFHNPLDKHVRLMSSVDDIKSGIFNNWPWGASEGTNYRDLYSTEADGTKKKLTLDGITTIYDVPDLSNMDALGLYLHNGNTSDYVIDESLRDDSDLGLENDGFKPIEAIYAAGDGFAYNESLAYQDKRKIDNTLIRLAGEGYVNGDMVNSGYAKTLRVIAHRNRIIDHCHNGNPINNMDIPMSPISESEGKSELDVLAQRMTDLRNWAKGTEPGQLGDTQNGDKWFQLYYPAVSACYAYEPEVFKSGEVLAARFRKHNWFLPTLGLLIRLWWYLFRYENNKLIIRDDSPFSEAIQKNKFVNISNNFTWSVTEISGGYCWYILRNSCRCVKYPKYEPMWIRAFASF